MAKRTTLKAERLIRMGEVAAYLGVSQRVVERLVRQGQIKAVRDPLDNRRKLVSARELDELKQRSLAASEEE
jgi:excisionase family DNA binding protein